jgi:hypothetical protein
MKSAIITVMLLVATVAAVAALTTIQPNAKAALDDWTLQVNVRVSNPDAGPVTISASGGGFSGTDSGTHAIFGISGKDIAPGESYQVCASQEGGSSVCKTFIHNPGDAESVTIHI